MKKIVQKDRLLPLETIPADALYKRKGSRFWQARYRDTNGTLHRRSTGHTLKDRATQWMALAKQEANRAAAQTTTTETHFQNLELF